MTLQVTFEPMHTKRHAASQAHLNVVVSHKDYEAQ